MHDMQFLSAQGQCKGLKVVKSCSLGGHFLFTCSDTFATGCIVWPQCTVSQMDGQTDDNTVPIIEHTACSTTG